jgi:hypothetical protein
MRARIAKARTVLGRRQAEAKNLNLLSLYTSRFHCRFEKNMRNARKRGRTAPPSGRAPGRPRPSHRRRRSSRTLAKTKGENYNMSEAFTRRDFEFSTEEITCMVNCWARLQEAKKFAAAPQKGLRKAA